MGRRKLPPVAPESFVHITSRTCNGAWYPLALNLIWEIYEDHLYFLRHGLGAEIFGFVLMSNHSHLIARFPENNMSYSMNIFQRDVSLEINRLAGRKNQSFGGPYFPVLIKDSHHLDVAYRYLYQNPVRAGICNSIFDYRFSTLNVLFGKYKSAIPITVDAISNHLHYDDNSRLWLDKLPPEHEALAVDKAFKKRIFELPVDRATRRVVNIGRAKLSKK